MERFLKQARESEGKNIPAMATYKASRIAEIKMSDNTKFYCGYRRTGSVGFCWWECEWIISFVKVFCIFSSP